MTKDIYYAAYGSNLNHHQMRQRCPAAQPIAAAVLPDWQLVFRGVADITPAIDNAVPVGLYKITAACEAALDHYENFPTLYGKKIIDLHLDGRALSVMTYIMTPRYGYGPPSPPPSPPPPPPPPPTAKYFLPNSTQNSSMYEPYMARPSLKLAGSTAHAAAPWR